jgi:hypothetical protein
LEQTFVAAFSEKLCSEKLREELVQELFAHLRKAQKERKEEALLAGARREEVETNQARLLREQRNLLNAIKSTGGTRSMQMELKEIDEKIERLDGMLEAPEPTPAPEITRDEVRAILATEVEHFGELLLGAPEKAKEDFQKRIEKIVLTPFHDEHGVAYKVTGDVDLFSAPGYVMQINQVHTTAPHLDFTEDTAEGVLGDMRSPKALLAA